MQDLRRFLFHQAAIVLTYIALYICKMVYEDELINLHNASGKQASSF